MSKTIIHFRGKQPQNNLSYLIVELFYITLNNSLKNKFVFEKVSILVLVDSLKKNLIPTNISVYFLKEVLFFLNTFF